MGQVARTIEQAEVAAPAFHEGAKAAVNGIETSGAESCWAMVDGHRMHYLKAGNGPALLLIHGIIGSCFSWRRNIEALSQNATVYAVDLLGLGHSERVAKLDASLEATAERLRKFMDEAGLRQADVCGTSHGGALAMVFAARFRKRVRRLILVAPANPFSKISDPIVRFYKTSLGKWFGLHVPFLPRKVQEIALAKMYSKADRIQPGTLDSYVAALQVPGTAQHVMNVLDGWFRDMESVRDSLAGLQDIPMLLIWGADDKAVSVESGRRLHAMYPEARFVVLEAAGHLPYEELPEQFNGAIQEFLRTVKPRRFRWVQTLLGGRG